MALSSAQITSAFEVAGILTVNQAEKILTRLRLEGELSELGRKIANKAAANATAIAALEVERQALETQLRQLAGGA